MAPEGMTAWAPSWSADGGLMAFYAAERDEGPVDVHLWNPRTRTSRRLTDVPVVARGFPGERPRWMADGRSLSIPVAPAGWPGQGERQARPAGRGGAHRARFARREWKE